MGNSWKVLRHLIEFVELSHSLHRRMIPVIKLILEKKKRKKWSKYIPTVYPNNGRREKAPSSSRVQSLNDCRHVSEDTRVHQSWTKNNEGQSVQEWMKIKYMRSLSLLNPFGWWCLQNKARTSPNWKVGILPEIVSLLMLYIWLLFDSFKKDQLVVCFTVS